MSRLYTVARIAFLEDTNRMRKKVSTGRTVSRNTDLCQTSSKLFLPILVQKEKTSKIICFLFFVFLLSRNNQLRKLPIFLTKVLSCWALKFSLRKSSGINYIAVVNGPCKRDPLSYSKLSECQLPFIRTMYNAIIPVYTLPLTPNCIFCSNITGEVFLFFSC